MLARAAFSGRDAPQRSLCIVAPRHSGIARRGTRTELARPWLNAAPSVELRCDLTETSYFLHFDRTGSNVAAVVTDQNVRLA